MNATAGPNPAIQCEVAALEAYVKLVRDAEAVYRLFEKAGGPVPERLAQFLRDAARAAKP